MSKANYIKDEIDAIIISRMICGDTPVGIGIKAKISERAIQIRWKNIQQRLHCKTANHATAKITATLVRSGINIIDDKKIREMLLGT